MIVSRSHLLEIFFTKLKLNLRAEVSRTYLGYIWWVLEPALYVAVLYVVFAILRNPGSDTFLAFLVCGKVPMLWFSKSVNGSSNSIASAKSLISQIAMPKAFFPLMSVCQAAVKQFFVFILMLVFLLNYGLEPSWTWLFMLYVVLVQALLIVACALVAAALTNFIPDFKYLISTGMILLMLCSGVFFDYKSVVLPRHHELFLLNPMARLLKNYRQVLMDLEQPDWLALAALGLVCTIIIIVMLHIYRKADNVFSRLATA